MERVVEPELLDELPPEDPRAVHSRGDLRRVNWLMRHADMFAATFKDKLKTAPRSIVEIGAGDGSLLLALAKQNHVRWPDVRVTLVDQQRIITDRTLAEFRELGWPVEVIVADIFDWLPTAPAADVVLANLFLHHFPDATLAGLFRALAPRTSLFVACETRRDWPSFAILRLLGLLGCNSVTRYDARLSMNAGFIGNELSAFWPKDDRWQLTERRAILFTHLFVAQRAG